MAHKPPQKFETKSTRVFVVDGAPADLSSLRMIQLPHPKYESKAFYGIGGNKCFEIQKVHEKPSSWFIGDSVKRDGGFYLCTQIDPVFLALQAVKLNTKQSDDNDGVFCEKSQLFDNPDYPKLALIEEIENLKIEHICETRESTGDTYYRYDQKKVIEWLKKKVERIRIHLSSTRSSKKESESQSSSNSSSSENKENKEDQTEEEKEEANELTKKEALGIISEYISVQLFEKLLEEYGLKLNDIYGSKKRKLEGAGFESVTGDKEYDAEFQQAHKKRKSDLEKIAKEKKKREQDIKKRKLNAKGMKSLANYFKPSAKKAKKK